MADPSFLQKLWDKGVDIAASVVASTISAAVIAAIATVTWRYKRKRDLQLEEDKQRQHARIESELALESQERQNREHLKHLKTELADFVAAMKGAASQAQLNELWRRYNVWLLNNGVNLREGNQRILSDGNEVLRDERLEVAFRDRADEMSRLVALTDWEPR
jgi:hypothetical protein